MSSNSKLELPPPIQNRNTRNKAEQTRDDQKTRTKKKKNLLLLQIIVLQSVSAKTGTFFHTAAKENQRLHQMQQLYAQQIANVHFENGFVSSHSTQNRQRENFKNYYSPSAP